MRKKVEELPKRQAILFPNLLAQQKLLDWAGLSFGAKETFKIYCALRNLAEEQNAKEIRFWGKILCSEKDYYIAEGVTPNKYADKLPEDCE